MIRKDCDDCIKRQTMYCPNSNECYCTFEKPYHLDNLKALNQLQQKGNIIKEVKRLIEQRIDRVEELTWLEMKREDYIDEQQEFLEILEKGETK